MGTWSFLGVNQPGLGVNNPTHLAPNLENDQDCTTTLLLRLLQLFSGDLYLYVCGNINEKTDYEICFASGTQMPERKKNIYFF